MDPTTTFSSAEVQPLMAEMLTHLNTTLGALKQACAERDQARQMLAEKDRVMLEKIASARVDPFTFSEVAITATVNAMVGGGFCPPEFATKLASDLRQSPGKALECLEHVASLSASTLSTGRGLSKSASTTVAPKESTGDEPEEDWGEMVRNGAQ